MLLRLFHGRTSPNEELNDWGFDGPIIENVSALTGIYGAMYAHFENEQHLLKAHSQTGWEYCGDYALVVQTHEDLLQTIDGYFGDWELSKN